MDLIHEYLGNKIDPATSETAKTIHALLTVLAAHPNYPRSVSVRLYHLLQTSTEEKIRAAWQTFGIALLAGRLAARMEPLWDLKPSAGHEWVAQLAVNAGAIVLSLNYDGLTHRAIDKVSGGQARVLSTAEEITAFFTSSPPGSSSTLPVPIIKIRGDVFHAVCDNGRCPDLNKSVPIYQLWHQTPRDADPESRARDCLACPTCREPRGLRISFPGVLGKERAIDEALGALHEIHGSRIAGVIFLGFSNGGKWQPRNVDQAAVERLIEERTSPAVKAALKSLLDAPAPGNGRTKKTRRTT